MKSDGFIRFLVRLFLRFFGKKAPEVVRTAVDETDKYYDTLKAKDDLTKLAQQSAVTGVKQGLKDLEEKSRRIAQQAHRR